MMSVVMIRLSGVAGETSRRRRNETTPDEMTPRVDDVEIEDDLDVTRTLQRGDGLARRHVFGQREDLRVHDAAGRLLGVLEQLTDVAAGRPLLHQLEDGGRQLLGQVVDDRGGIVRRQVLDELDDLVSGPIGEQAGAGLGPELAQTLHCETAVALDEKRERGVSVLVGKLGEELREIGGVLLLQQVHEIRGRPHALEALHRIEHDIELALRHWQSDRESANCSM